MVSSSILLVLVVALVNCQDTTMPTTTMPATTTPPPTIKPKQCWMDAFPPTRATNDLTCQVCTVIFQGLDDYLLNNEEQVPPPPLIHQTMTLLLNERLQITICFNF